MIRANELRLGNYILDVFDLKNAVIRKIDLEDLSMFINYSNHPLPFRPIQLTEEILLKSENIKVSFSSDPQECGASKLYKIGELHIHQPNEDESYFIAFVNHKTKHLKYLHQLQNLYFELNNQELNIKL